MDRSQIYPGIMIMLSAVAALAMCNLGFNDLYQHIWAQSIQISLGQLSVTKQLLPLVNEGLMALFFLAVTIEIRHEFTYGALSDRVYRVMPFIAAVGGMVAPAMIYLFFNYGSEYSVGWAIPTATDIAFSLACLMLVGSRFPIHLRTFLLSLAVIDDLGAILIIAVYYSDHLSVMMLVGGGLVVASMALLRFMKITSTVTYMVFGFALWLFMLKSGVHATLTGCVVAMLLPMQNDQGKRAMAFHDALLPWVQYVILPLFALANTGVIISSGVNVFHPMFLGIFCGLVLGKPLGVVFCTFVAEKLKVAKLPQGLDHHHILGIGFLCGIGFTMSLFVGMLAFDEELLPLLDIVKSGVLSASLASGILGMLFLKYFCKGEDDERELVN
ncbi:MAG: Na+/H+ antiporter NhaA [Pseudomonadota bacterium]|nr:Na+/H+ antiporter NhaA [Pseudomonadota bacterium]